MISRIQKQCEMLPIVKTAGEGNRGQFGGEWEGRSEKIRQGESRNMEKRDRNYPLSGKKKSANTEEKKRDCITQAKFA